MAVIRAYPRPPASRPTRTFRLWLFGTLLLCQLGYGAVLPEDRADALYHAFDGGGVTVQGPSVLVRKGIKDKVSFYANLYQDMVTSASIDVISYGSPYTEQRDEYSVGADYLQDSTVMSLSFSNSSENDYIANTVSFGLSQDFFGDMTTLSLGYSKGDDTVMKNDGAEKGDENYFEAQAGRQRYSLGLTQVLTKSWIIAFSAETAVDEGFLRNPYRQSRYWQTTSDGVDRVWRAEEYPTTRNSDAFAVRTMYYLPYRASIKLEARTFADSWGIQSQNYEIRYTHPIRSRMLLELKARTYSQTQADFYSDFYQHGARDYFARDKELSTYSSNSIGVGLTYEFGYKIPYTKNHKLSVFWDYLQFDYDNFLDQCRSTQNYCNAKPETPADYDLGEEPTYGFAANVLRVFFTVNY